MIPVADPADAGALLDGTADHREAVSQAIESLPDGGGLVVLEPEAVVRLDGVLRIEAIT